jgi:hypothetical protein
MKIVNFAKEKNDIKVRGVRRAMRMKRYKKSRRIAWGSRRKKRGKGKKM